MSSDRATAVDGSERLPEGIRITVTLSKACEIRRLRLQCCRSQAVSLATIAMAGGAIAQKEVSTLHDNNLCRSRGEIDNDTAQDSETGKRKGHVASHPKQTHRILLFMSPRHWASVYVSG
jgi:hypothetical protein